MLKLKLIASCTLLIVATNAIVATDPWGYRDFDPEQAGPSFWGTLYPKCNGKKQSPVNLVYRGESVNDQSETTYQAPLVFYGDCEQFNLRTLEDLLKWELTGSSTSCQVSLPLEGGKTYSLAQFHIHTPSEHTLNGEKFDGEIHFVHKADSGNGEILVTGVFLKKSPDVPENNWIKRVWSSIKASSDENAVPIDLQVNYVDLLNSQVGKSHLFNYRGSLTTPPCSEIVNWWVMKKPVYISETEYEILREKYSERPNNAKGDDARPIQPLNGRIITYY
jgi:carbonic anhydrase